MFLKNINNKKFLIILFIASIFFVSKNSFAASDPAQNAGKILNQEQELEKQKKIPKEIPKSLIDKKSDKKKSGSEVKILVKEFKFEGDIKLVSKDILKNLVKDYVGKSLTFDEIQSVLEVINSYYAEKGYFLASAILPKQEVKDGVIIILVNEGKLDSKQPYEIKSLNLRIKESIIKEKSLDLQVLEAYQEGVKSLETGDVLYAAKKFNEAETLFPQSEWAPKSALMAAYAYYTQDYYSDTIAELERFIRVYPLSKNLDYVYYLLGFSYYEQIVDEKKDLQSIIKAKEYFKIVSKNYPNTNYSLDAEYKIDLVNDTLASKEMYIGRYYFDKKKWIPAINRFRTVIDNYETTIYAQEALHRLVEVHYILGLKDEAKKYAKLLGYNYQSSKWYGKSYSVFDKEYKENVKKRDKKRSKKNKTLKKIKSLFSLDG